MRDMDECAASAQQGGSCSSSSAHTGAGVADCTDSDGAGMPRTLKRMSGIMMEPGRPVVFAVGHMGKAYWQWVNQPEAGMPRFFASPLAEACSKTPWWVVPLVWLPIFVGVQAYCASALGVSMAALLCWLLVGVLAWQGLEYAIHRWVFHANLTSYWGITFHFLFHGCHHKYPMDGQRLVFPPLPASALVAAVYAVLTLVLPRACALPLFAGMGYGYVAYDCLHYAIHHCRAGRSIMGMPVLRELQRRHMHHHYRDHGHGYGISSTLYDQLLGTSAKVA